MAVIIDKSKAQTRLVWLYFLFILVGAMVIWKGGDALRDQQVLTLRIDTVEQLNQLGNVLENAITKYQHMPALLASNDRVRQSLRDGLASDINQLNRELEQINRITEASNSYIINKNGRTIAASNYQQADSFVGKNFAFRPYFQQAIKGKLGRYYALGTTSNRRGYYFSYPVYEGDSIIGVAVVKIELDQFESRFSNQTYDFLLLDPDQVVFSSSRPEWLYKVMGELSHQELARIVDSRRYKDQLLTKLPIVSSQLLAEQFQIIDILESPSGDNGSGELERNSYLKMSRPIASLGFQMTILSPLQTIHEDIALWRAFIAGTALIVALIVGLVFLRNRMLRERSVAIEMSRHNQAYIREVIQNTQAGLVTLDAAKRIESFNPAIEKLIGQPLLPLIGQGFDHLFKADTKAMATAKTLDETLAEEVFEFITAEGQLCYLGVPQKAVEMTLCEMQLPNSRKYLVTFHDMTERKRYEHELTQASLVLEQRVSERTHELQVANLLIRQEIDQHNDTQRELIQTAKLAVLGQLSAGINHEMNQPLTAMRVFADNALTFIQRGKLDKVESNLQQIRQLGIHMSDIIARFKVFARRGDIQQGAVSVHHAIRAAVSIMEARIKEGGIQLQLPTPDDSVILGDMVFLEQVLVNLLSNAVDAIIENYSTQHSNSAYNSTQHTNGERVIEISVQANQDQTVTLKVMDTGAGLSEETQQHLFEPFYTSKSHGAGLGLGLSISQRIVEVMGGRIYAENRAAKGAQFCVILNVFPQAS